MSKKIFKKAVIGIISAGLLYLLLLLVAGIYAGRHKQQILDKAAQLLKENLNGDVSIKDIDISVWKDFPLISFSAENIVWTDSVRHAPLLSLGSVSSTFNPFGILFSSRTIRNIHVKEGRLHIFTDSTGYTNTYLLAAKKNFVTGAQDASNDKTAIDNFTITDLDIIVEDKIKQKEISLYVHKLEASTSQSATGVAIEMQEKIQMKKGLGFNLVKGAYLENASIDGKWKLLYEAEKKKLAFSPAQVDIEGHPFLLNGYFIFDKAAPAFSVRFETNNLVYATAEKMVTTAIRKKLNQYDVKGALQVKGTIAGSLLPAHEPSVDISCSTKENSITTSFAILSDCAFTGHFTNSVNPDSTYSDKNTAIRFSGFSCRWNKIPVTAKNIIISNLDSPALKADVRADASLRELDAMLSLKEMAFENGRALFDLSYDGPLKDGVPAIEKVQGVITISNGSVNYVPRDFDFTGCNGVIHLFKDSISMRGFVCRYQSNQFTINVDGSNMRGKLLSADSLRPALITCAVVTPAVDLGNFTSLFAGRKMRSKSSSAAKDLSSLSRAIDLFIGNSVIDITMKAGNIKNQHLEAKNFEAHIRFEPAQWLLSKIAFQVGSGTIQAKGRVAITTDGNHRAGIQVAVSNADINKLLYAFDNFGQEAVTYQELRGNFLTAANLQLDISSAGHIVPESMHGSVQFSLKDGSLDNFSPFERLKTFVFKKRNLDHVKFAEIKDRFDISADGIYVNRMEVQSTAFRLFIEGKYGLNKKNTDLLLQLPFSNLSDNSFSGDSVLQNQGTDRRKLGNIWLRAVNDDDGKIKVKLTLNRKVKDTLR